MVTGVTYRNPALLAKQVTTLDVVSAGRAILGIGAAWNEEEHAGYGFEFPPIGERMDRLEEALQICRAMFTEQRSELQRATTTRSAGAQRAAAAAPEGIPILVGGGGERRTLALVAQYADACNLFGDVGHVRHKLDVLERHCEAIGRDPADDHQDASRWPGDRRDGRGGRAQGRRDGAGTRNGPRSATAATSWPAIRTRSASRWRLPRCGPRRADLQHARRPGPRAGASRGRDPDAGVRLSRADDRWLTRTTRALTPDGRAPRRRDDAGALSVRQRKGAVR